MPPPHNVPSAFPPPPPVGSLAASEGASPAPAPGGDAAQVAAAAAREKTRTERRLRTGLASLADLALLHPGLDIFYGYVADVLNMTSCTLLRVCVQTYRNPRAAISSRDGELTQGLA